MIRELEWTARTWTFDLPVRAFPALLERVRGTPVRAAALVADVDEQLLARRPAAGGWSIKEHLGHLDDLHQLDERRLAEFLAGAPELTAADMGNRRTFDANHGATPTHELIARLAAHRKALVAQLETLTEEQVGATAIHPRLERQMRLIDWIQFVAEHDDHHLAKARQVLRDLADES